MFLLFNIIFCLFTLRYELEKKSSLVTRAFSAKSCTRDTDSLHSCTRLRLVQEMACLYHECKILPRKHSYPNLIPIFIVTYQLHQCLFPFHSNLYQLHQCLFSIHSSLPVLSVLFVILRILSVTSMLILPIHNSMSVTSMFIFYSQ